MQASQDYLVVMILANLTLSFPAVYLGNRMFDPIWEELNARRAAVFLHGAQTRPERPDPHDFLGVPIVEVPHETFKAAASLVVSGRKRKYPAINFVLAHLGGSTPFLAPRVAVLSNYMGSGLTPDDILDDFKTFYYDTALSSHETTLTAMQSFVGPDRLVFGTDFPGTRSCGFGKFAMCLPLCAAVSKDMAAWYTKQTNQFHTDPDAPVWRENVLKILSNME
jgi:predicted TIM-barrel fold metal-dependent hydrolase